MTSLRVSLWNANGVSRYKLEIAQFINDNEMDVMLLPETTLQTNTISKSVGTCSTVQVIPTENIMEAPES